MADNVTLDAGVGGAVVKTDDDGTAHWQYVKVSFGADNTQTRVTATTGLPAKLLAGTAEFGKLAAGVAEIGKVTNSGTFAVQVDGAALTALQLIDDVVYVDDADWTNSTSKHMLVGGLYQSAPQTITDGDTGPLQVDASGNVIEANSAAILADTANMDTNLGTVASDTTAIKTAVELLDNAVDGSYLNTNMNIAGTDVSANAGVLTAQTQRVTIATDDEVNNLLGTIDADTGAIKTAVELIDNAIAGSEMQVDVVAALPVGSNAIGKLAANSGVDIGDVDVTSVVPGTGATNLGKIEDAAHSSGDVGVMALGVRNDALNSLVGADADYAPFQLNSSGALYTREGPNVVDSGNSTTSAINADIVFTGTGKDVLGCSGISIILDASHDSATDGMTFQWSSDDVNWDVTKTFTYTATDGGRTFQFGVQAQYFRVVYTNGGTNQTHFRVQTLLQRSTVATTVHRLVDNTDPDRSASLTKSAIIAQAAGSGDFVPVAATAGGNLKVAIEEIDGPVGGGTEAAALRVTLANNSTGLVSVDDNGGSLTVDSAVLDTIDTVLDTINAKLVDGTDIGDVTVNNGGSGSAVNIQDGGNSITVDGTITEANSGAIKTAVEIIDNSIFVDDAAFSLTSSSVDVAGAIRDDALGALAAAEGDAVPLRVSATGALHVTGGGGGTEYTEDVATANPIVGTATVMERDDALSALTPIEGDWASLRCSAEGALWTQDFNSDAVLADTTAIKTAVEAIDNAVDGSYLNTNMNIAGTDVVGGAGVLAAGVQRVTIATDDEVNNFLGTIDADTSTLAGAVAAGQMQVDIVASIPAGTNGIGKLTANSGVDIGDVDVLSLPASTNTLEVVGDVAHDAAAAGNPVLVAGRATSSVEGLTEVATNDSSFIATDLSGVVITRNAVANEELVSFYVANTDGAEDAVTGLDAGGATIFNYITSVTVHNAHASTNGFVTLLDGSGGSIFWVFPAPATGGVTMNFNPPLKQKTVNTALYVDVSAAITTMYISIAGFQGQG